MLPEDLQSRRSSSPTQRRPCPAFPGFEKVTIIYSTTGLQTSASPLSSLSIVRREPCTDSTPELLSSLASLSAHLHSSSDTTTSHPEQGKEAPAFPGCSSPPSSASITGLLLFPLLLSFKRGSFIQKCYIGVAAGEKVLKFPNITNFLKSKAPCPPPTPQAVSMVWNAFSPKTALPHPPGRHSHCLLPFGIVNTPPPCISPRTTFTAGCWAQGQPHVQF